MIAEPCHAPSVWRKSGLGGVAVSAQAHREEEANEDERETQDQEQVVRISTQIVADYDDYTDNEAAQDQPPVPARAGRRLAGGGWCVA